LASRSFSTATNWQRLLHDEHGQAGKRQQDVSMPTGFAKSTVFNAAGSIAMIGSGFLTTVIVARLLGPEAVGLVAYVAFIAALSLAILDMGLPGTLTRFLPELEAEGRDDQAAALTKFLFVPYLVAGTLYSVGLIWLLDPAAFHFSGAPVDEKLFIYFVACTVFVQSLAVFYYGMLKGRRLFPAFARITVVSAIVQLAVTWTGIWLFGIKGALAAPIAGFLIAALLAFRSLACVHRVDRALRVRATNFAWRTWGTYFLTTIAWSRMEIYFLKHSWGDQAAGLFAAGLNLANLAFQLPMLLTGALVPILVLKSRSDSPEQFARSYADAIRYFALLVFPACLGAAAITPSLLPLLYGQAFADAAVPAMILIAGCCTMTFITIVQQYAMAVERTTVMLWLAALGAGLSILSGLTLTPAYGVDGAAVGRVIAQATVAVAMLVYARSMGWSTPYKSLGGVLVASCIGAGMASVIIRWLPGAVGIATAVATAVVVYILLIKYFRLLSENDRRLVDRLATNAPLRPSMRATIMRAADWLRR
jgi:O-antigen/teichoic acid export membrane protein